MYKKVGTDSDQRAEFEISGWHGFLGPEPLCERGRLAAELRSVRQTRQAGVNLSVRELLGQLAGTEEAVFLYRSTGGRPRARRMLPTQQRLYDLFDLALCVTHTHPPD